MDFYQSLGHLVLGSRLRRLSEYYLSEVNRVYQEQGIEFEASWFPVFYILSAEGALQEWSIRALADRMQVSHSAVSQLLANLKKKGLIFTRASADDRRVQTVCLTEKGRRLLEQVTPIWTSIRSAMEEIADADPGVHMLLNNLSALEDRFAERHLSLRALQHLNHTTCTTE